MLLETIHHKKCAPKGNLQSQLSQIKLYSLKVTPLISNPPSIFNLQIWYQIKRWLSLYIPYSYIEKKRFASWVNDFRPADLLSNLYEIITKVLSNRFWKFHGRIYPHSWMLHGKWKNHASQGCAIDYVTDLAESDLWIRHVKESLNLYQSVSFSTLKIYMTCTYFISEPKEHWNDLVPIENQNGIHNIGMNMWCHP